jgi:NADH dehydrogenase
MSIRASKQAVYQGLDEPSLEAALKGQNRYPAVAALYTSEDFKEGPLAFAAWLGVHAMLLSGAHSRADAFMSWAWDYFDRDHAATVEWSTAPQRIAWGDDSADVPHIIVDRGDSTTSAGSN